MIFRKILYPATVLLVVGCLEGPWDFMPNNPPAFNGIWASVYAVAAQPANNVCFERLVPLTQGFTDAFPWYDSAEVGIEGVFSSGTQTLTLTPLYESPNCFSGSSSVLFQAGQTYNLSARFVWDSSGREVASLLEAVAHVPASFSITDSAAAPGLALTSVNTKNLFNPNIYMQLPAGPLAQIMELYGDTLNKLSGDTAATNAYIRANAGTLIPRALAILAPDAVHYPRGDTLFYIGGSSVTNNLAHVFHSTRSSDVNGVLIAQRFDTTASVPVTSLDSIGINLGLKPDTGRSYIPGDIRSLALDPNTVNSNGSNALDSLHVLNSSFLSGLNRLYFYGVEKAYTDYIFSNVEVPGEGSVESNPKIISLTNVTGGRGFFAGMVEDSFDVFIKLDSTTTAYSYPAARADACRDQGWYSSRECAGYYHQFCSENGWVRSDCQLDAIYTCLDSAESATAPPGLCDSADAYAAKDPALKLEATEHYCIDNDYPASASVCAPVEQECNSGSLANGCQLILWQTCNLDYWQPAACTDGRVSYCQEYSSTQMELCRGVGGN